MFLKTIIESFSLIGGLISVAGFFPQVIQLIKEKNSAGNSKIAWYMWTVSNLVLLFYAIYIKDPVFTILQFLFVALCLITLILIHKYKKIKK